LLFLVEETLSPVLPVKQPNCPYKTVTILHTHTHPQIQTRKMADDVNQRVEDVLNTLVSVTEKIVT